jgi:hypothetical protein
VVSAFSSELSHLLVFGRDVAMEKRRSITHDMEGFRSQRIFNFLSNSGVVRTEERIELAFGCLLTAVRHPDYLVGLLTAWDLLHRLAGLEGTYAVALMP